jgi:hypothetical protein
VDKNWNNNHNTGQVVSYSNSWVKSVTNLVKIGLAACAFIVNTQIGRESNMYMTSNLPNIAFSELPLPPSPTPLLVWLFWLSDFDLTL